MKSLALLALLISVKGFAKSSKNVLELRMEKPYLHCEVGTDSATIIRRLEGVTFSKVVQYKISSLEGMIAAAFDNRRPETLTSEYMAYYRDNGAESVSFALDLNEPNALKLIRLISTLCEVRRL